jgi:hypothetical protein
MGCGLAKNKEATDCMQSLKTPLPDDEPLKLRVKGHFDLSRKKIRHLELQKSTLRTIFEVRSYLELSQNNE